MANLTRHAAIEAARREYEVLVQRARELAPDDAEYIDALSELWQGRLQNLAKVRANPPLSNDAQAALSYLDRQIADAADVEKIVAWVDAYPDAIAQMLPPSALTFRVELGRGAREAATQQLSARDRMMASAA